MRPRLQRRQEGPTHRVECTSFLLGPRRFSPLEVCVEKGVAHGALAIGLMPRPGSTSSYIQSKYPTCGIAPTTPSAYKHWADLSHPSMPVNVIRTNNSKSFQVLFPPFTRLALTCRGTPFPWGRDSGVWQSAMSQRTSLTSPRCFLCPVHGCACGYS